MIVGVFDCMSGDECAGETMRRKEFDNRPLVWSDGMVLGGLCGGFVK